MEHQIFDIVRLESADGIRDGEYDGRWCGNRVLFSTPYGDYQASTGEIYIKGDEACIVTFSAGLTTVRVRST